MLFCDSLSDPKKRAKFERYGTVETEELVLIHSPHYVDILTALFTGGQWTNLSHISAWLVYNFSLLHTRIRCNAHEHSVSLCAPGQIQRRQAFNSCLEC